MIHPTAVIGDGVTIGERVTVAPYAVILGPCVIGDDVYIGSHTTIGAPAQSSDFAPAPGGLRTDAVGVRIHHGACIRELCTVHQGTMRETVVGEDALIMAGTHVGHDVLIDCLAVLSVFCSLGGFTHVGHGANLGQHVVTHPWVVIGEGSMVGLNTSVIRDVEPFTKVAGAPARLLGSNTRKRDQVGETVALRALYDFAKECSDRDALKGEYYRSKEAATA